MSSTANNNSASNPGGRPSNTTRSAPNMAPDASWSANCDPAANAYTQITLPGGITIAVQAPDLVFTFGDQPSSSSSSEQQGRTAAPFILRQLSASVNGNGNGNDSNGSNGNGSNGNGSSGNGSRGLNSSTSSPPSSNSSAKINRILAYLKRANNRLLSSYRAQAASRGAPEEVSRKRSSPPGTSSEAAEAAPEGE
ncbi:hypothetical protein TYRP_016889 [Tyrophagus putrescentiae]|nr:hypothetical protein TYRP_016889 [Tyrophagus putrescentiae]